MPWLETKVSEQRMQFVIAAKQPSANFSVVCRTFGVSRRALRGGGLIDGIGRALAPASYQSVSDRRDGHGARGGVAPDLWVGGPQAAGVVGRGRDAVLDGHH